MQERENQMHADTTTATHEARATTADLDAVLDETTRRRKSVTRDAADYLGVPANKVCGLLRAVWGSGVSKGQEPLTDQELFQGMSLIARYHLDPITREVYVSRDKRGRLMVIVGVDGWVKILDRTPDYDGLTQELEFDSTGKTLVAVTTTIYSTKRTHPTCYKAFAQEYQRVSGFVAQSMPWHMLRIFSLRHAARLFTPVGANVMMEEEAEFIQRQQEREDTPAQSPVMTRLLESLKDSNKGTPDDAVIPPKTEPVAVETATPEPDEATEEAAAETVDDGGPEPGDVDAAWQQEGGF